MKNVFIIGSKGIPANYGGFETFVDKLTMGKVKKNIKYHVACMSDNFDEFEHNNARCFNVKVPEIGAAKAVYYDIIALNKCIKYIEKNNVQDAIIYILACRIGPFIFFFKNKLKKMNIPLFINPDGHEWKRAKWNKIIRMYWKQSEKLMVKHSDLIICDSINIEKYINKEYSEYKPSTIFIAYGADAEKSILNDNDYKFLEWMKKNDTSKNDYYLIVGRFVPENNYKLIIEEFMKSKSERDLVIISNVEKNKFYDELLTETKFDKDKRIKFVGTVYDQELLKKIRESSYAYIHGHEVGGTNPSLLEALASTDLNILLDVGFNREVAEQSAVYFNKSNTLLRDVIEDVEKLSENQIKVLAENSTKRIRDEYNWGLIVERYEKIFNEFKF